MSRRCGAVLGPLVMMSLVVAACVPETSPPPTRLDVLTRLTWCGGVQPPPGEPACHTSSRATRIEVRQRRTVITAGVTNSDGHLLLEVPSGASLTIVAVDAPSYEQCDEPVVVAVEAATTPVVQTCTVFAP